jgi:hypothetical protein
LISPTRAREITNGRSLDSFDAGLADALARDAVRGDARGYRPPAWWDDIEDCGGFTGMVDQPRSPARDADTDGRRRILYDMDDPVARNLAERIVALAASPHGSSSETDAVTRIIPGLSDAANPPGAEGVTIGQLGLSLKAGDDFAYIIALPRRTPIPCYEAGELVARAPWLAALGRDFLDALVPLVETRPHVIARKNEFGVYADWYNNLFIVNEPAKE